MASTLSVSLARRIVRDLMIYTRGQQQRWVPVETIERRLLLKDEKATDAALALAIEKAGWQPTPATRSGLPMQAASWQRSERQHRKYRAWKACRCGTG